MKVIKTLFKKNKKTNISFQEQRSIYVFLTIKV